LAPVTVTEDLPMATPWTVTFSPSMVAVAIASSLLATV